MKFFALSSAFLLSVTAGFSQQKPEYTQYIMNQYILNPALSGIDNYTDVKLSNRQQWLGLQGAPITTYFTINTPIDKKDDRTNATTQFQLPEESSIRGKDMLSQYEVVEPHHGVGLQIINDNIGPFDNFSAFATYAYHVGLTKKTSLSAGIAAGVSKLSLDAQKLYFGSTTPIDPAVYSSSEIGKTMADMNAGIWLYSINYFAGVSVNQIIPHKIDFSGDMVTINKGKLVPHIFATAGYRFLLSDDVSLIPSVMVKSVSPVPTQVDINAKVQFMNVFWVGLSDRLQYGYAAMAGMTIHNNFLVSYSYDYSTTQINTVSHGTHEIMLGFIINKTKETCPQRIW